eukprot:6214319-Pleurochrysis_carterae.AAC.2
MVYGYDGITCLDGEAHYGIPARKDRGSVLSADIPKDGDRYDPRSHPARREVPEASKVHIRIDTPTVVNLRRQRYPNWVLLESYVGASSESSNSMASSSSTAAASIHRELTGAAAVGGSVVAALGQGLLVHGQQRGRRFLSPRA